MPSVSVLETLLQITSLVIAAQEVIMIIYLICNKINGKSYVGQTVHKTFNLRYSGGRWWDITDNPALINAHAKYGENNFEIIILEKGVESIDKLNELEEFYAEKYNCYAPNGYNLRKCGYNRKLLQHQIEMIRENKSKKYTLRKVDTWEIIEIFNLKDFCRKQGFDEGALYNMIKERDGVIVSNGYCLPKRTKQEVEERRMRGFKGKVFEIVDESGTLIKVKNIKEFMRQHDLEKGSFYKLLNGEMLYYKGFRLPERVNEPKVVERYFQIISPTGETKEGYGLVKFCKENDLIYNCVLKVLNGELWEHRGWKNINTTEDELLFKGRSDKNPITLISPDGQEIYVENLYLFCNKNNLDYNLFYCLYKGWNKTALGWTTKDNLEKVSTKLINPNGEIVTIIGKGIKDFCKKQGFNYNSFVNMLSGNVGQYKGWRMVDSKFKYKRKN